MVNEDSDASQDEAESAHHHESIGDSAYLLESAAVLGGVRGAFRFGRYQNRTFPEELAQQVEAFSRLPSCELEQAIPIAAGGEHEVYRTADSMRVVKATLSGVFGRVMDEDVLLDPRTFLNQPRLKLRGALPCEYLARWVVLSSVFGLQTRFEGVYRTSLTAEPQLVISQPFIGEHMPDLEDVENLMLAHGFTKVEASHVINPENQDVTWYRQRDGLLITDAFARNFRMDGQTGAVIPIDLMVNIVPPGVSKLLPRATEPFTLRPAE